MMRRAGTEPLRHFLDEGLELEPPLEPLEDMGAGTSGKSSSITSPCAAIVSMMAAGPACEP